MIVCGGQDGEVKKRRAIVWCHRVDATRLTTFFNFAILSPSPTHTHTIIVYYAGRTFLPIHYCITCKLCLLKRIMYRAHLTWLRRSALQPSSTVVSYQQPSVPERGERCFAFADQDPQSARVARLDEKAPIGLHLADIATLEFGFGAFSNFRPNFLNSGEHFPKAICDGCLLKAFSC